MLTDIQAETTANRNYYNDKVTQYTQSYGDKLNGTAFEYLLHVKPEADPSTTAGDTQTRQRRKPLLLAMPPQIGWPKLKTT